MSKELPIISCETPATGAIRGPSLQPGPSNVTSGSSPLVFIETFGCQMNEYDTELVKSLLRGHGYRFTADRDAADVVLVNTCAIRENAHNRVYGYLADLKALKRARAVTVGVLGCMAQNLKEELAEEKPIIDVLVGPDAYRRLPALLDDAMHVRQEPSDTAMAVDLSEWDTYDDIVPARMPGVNAWIAVMRGCDNFCSFCVVPYTRGRERSRDPEGILREAGEAAAMGYRQITLLGQNVNSYRHGTWDFARLIAAVADTPGIERVRFTSPHPKDFPPALIDAIGQHPRICKHIHLPLQSGSDRILDLMNRTYTRAEYLSLVEAIRKRNPAIALTTDLICGFCSESEADFSDTERMVQDIGFHNAFIFKYSERKHTIAARKFPDDVPDGMKSTRVGRLMEIQRRWSLIRNREYIGRTLDVLVESDSKKSSAQWTGKTDCGVSVVWNKDERALLPGALAPIQISDANAATLFGTASPDCSSRHS